MSVGNIDVDCAFICFLQLSLLLYDMIYTQSYMTFSKPLLPSTNAHTAVIIQSGNRLLIIGEVPTPRKFLRT